jgi:ABC-type dipeptide/oligopeptide/nickel transport system permease component
MEAGRSTSGTGLFVALRVSLTLLLVPISLIALLALYVGLTFGFNLWNPATPLVTMVWLAVVSSPAWFYGLLIWSERSGRRSLLLCAISIAALSTGLGLLFFNH